MGDSVLLYMPNACPRCGREFGIRAKLQEHMRDDCTRPKRKERTPRKPHCFKCRCFHRITEPCMKLRRAFRR